MEFPRIYRRDGTPYPPGDEGLFAWAKDHMNLDLKIVRQEKLPNGLLVSTVWLGHDHDWSGKGPPIIFETMVFTEDGESLEQERYSTENDAIIGHMQMVEQFARHKIS